MIQGETGYARLQNHALVQLHQENGIFSQTKTDPRYIGTVRRYIGTVRRYIGTVRRYIGTVRRYATC